MENISALKAGKKLSRNVLSSASEISLTHIIIFAVCFIFSRASIFGVVRPFAVSFYVAVNLTGLLKIPAIISITLGNAIFSNIYETLRQTISLLLFEAFLYLIYKSGEKKETAMGRTLLITLITGLTGILRGLVQGIHVYDLVVSVISAALVFSLTVIFGPSCENFKNLYKNIVYDGRVIFSRAVFLSAFIISVKGIRIIGLELGAILAGIAIMLIARYLGGAEGAFAGAFIGTVVAIYDIPASLQFPGMLALAGAACGMPRKSRVAGPVLWLIVVTFFSGISVLAENMVLIFYESLASGLIFLVIPDSAKSFVGSLLCGAQKNIGISHEYGQIHEAADRLFVVGKALSRVSRNIEEAITEDNTEISGAGWIAEYTAEKVCSRCSLSDMCWKVNLIKTYRLVEKTISDLKTDETGQFEIPAWFRARCTRAQHFFETLGTAYSLWKTEKIWRMKLNESRLLLAKQAAIVSGNVIAAARSILDTSGRDYETEDLIYSAAVSGGIPVTSVRYRLPQGKKPYMEISVDAKNSINFEVIDELVQNFDNKLVRIGENRRDMMGYSIVRYMKKPRFRTATGIARAGKNNDSVSGDNFTFFISNEGLHINAISDGSGSGRRAEKISRSAIQMLENLLDEGLELEQAVRLINLYLDMKGETERLASMDILSIDLSDGRVSCYKYDAAPSFIKNREGVLVLGCDMTNEKGETVHYTAAKMEKDDIVIMVSDGVTQAFSEDGEISALQWFIAGLDTANAQELADALLTEAVSRAKGNHDDITILATKLW
mgnify:CR=1 FL=1